jgi:hypothetical protein
MGSLFRAASIVPVAQARADRQQQLGEFDFSVALLHEWPVVLSWRYETQEASLQIAINPAQDYREERPIPDK